MKINNTDINNILYTDVKEANYGFGLEQFNNTHYFMLPVFELRSVVYNNRNYIGSYVGDTNRHCDIENPLFVRFRFNGFEDYMYKRLSDSLKENRNYMFDYYSGQNEGEIVTFVFKSDKPELYNTVLNGMYSKLPISYINKCLSFPFSASAKRRIQGIILKQEWHKKEFLSVFEEPFEGDEYWIPFLEDFEYA